MWKRASVALCCLALLSQTAGCRACPRDTGGARWAVPAARAVEVCEGGEGWGFRYAVHGEWLSHELDREVRLWRHDGRPRAVWSRQGWRLLLNGRHHGVDLSGLSGPVAARWLREHRGWSGWVVLPGAALTPAVLQQLRRPSRLGLALVVEPGERVDLTRLVTLAPRLVALSLKEVTLTCRDARRLGDLSRLEALSLAGVTRGSEAGPRCSPASGWLRPLGRLRRLRLLDFTDVEVRRLEWVVGIRGLRRLLLAGTRVGDRALDALGELDGRSRLRALDLSRTPVSDFGVDRLTGMTGLRALDLSDTGVSDLGADLVAGLRGLRILRLGPHLTDLGISHLSDLAKLRVLALRRTAISGEGLAALRGLTQLRSLDLAWTDVGDAGLRHLAGMVLLRHLDLGRTRVTGRGLVHLGQAHLLRSLSLRWTPLEPDQLRWLTGLSSLRRVDLAGTASRRAPWRKGSLARGRGFGYKAGAEALRSR